jgi:hypothetical protein
VHHEHDGSESVDQIVSQLTASVAALMEAVKAQDAEVTALRGRLEGCDGPSDRASCHSRKR